jgi:hypothetical protein
MSVADDTLRISWDEKVPGALPMQEAREGFGTALEKAVLSRLSGTIARNWNSNGFSLFVEMPLAALVK